MKRRDRATQIGTLVRIGVILGLLWTNQAQAAFSQLYVFGDSFSDFGNVFAATGGILPPDPPYDRGRFSDGPLWVEHLAGHLGLPLISNGADPTVILGNGFAAGAARMAVDLPVPPLGIIPSVLGQTRYFTAAAPLVPADALYVVYGGYGDVLTATDPALELSPPAQSQLVADAVQAMGLALDGLAQRGARDFLVPNLADVGLTPESRFVRQNQAVASQLTRDFNQALEVLLQDFESSQDVQVFRLDVFGLANRVIDDATSMNGATFGITNVDVPIFAGFAGSPGADPDSSLFADTIHVSAAAHRLLGDQAFRAVPEPTAATLVLACLASVGWVVRRLQD